MEPPNATHAMAKAAATARMKAPRPARCAKAPETSTPEPLPLHPPRCRVFTLYGKPQTELRCTSTRRAGFPSTVSKRESPCAPHLPSINAIPSATSRNGGATRQLAKSRLGDYSVSIHLRAGARAGRHFSLAGPDFFVASQGYRESQGLRGLGVYFRTFYSGVGVGVG
ncbi:hypothetical protein PMIN03_002390 [Paraphaeosphaeria minitans]